MLPRNVLLAIRRSMSRSEYVVALTQDGFEVATADHALECLEVFGHFVPDVLVIEPELLWGGGDGVLAILKEAPQFSGMQVLVLTTDFNRAAVYSISQFRVSDFWIQPVSAERLTSRVARLALESQSPTTRQFVSNTEIVPIEAAIPRIDRPEVTGIFTDKFH